MLKGRGRDTRATAGSHPAPLTMRPPGNVAGRPPGPGHRTLMSPTRPEPDYEVVEFPTDQYVNAKLQPPPPPPPRPTAGHPVEAGASCGLCGGGGARVRCAECGRRALCASCDDMYHRHPKRRHHQRQALTASQIREDRPPLPPKVAAPVPPPRRHKIGVDRLSASPRPSITDQRRATLGHLSVAGHPSQTSNPSLNNHLAQHVVHQSPGRAQGNLAPAHIGSVPYLPSTVPHVPVPLGHAHAQSHTLGHLNNAWTQPRNLQQGYNMSPTPNMPAPAEAWGNVEKFSPASQGWVRPLRRGASVLDLGGGAGACAGCTHCAPGWRYGSCASLDHAWPQAWPQPACCTPHPMHPHSHHHTPHTPQPYRRVDSRAVSRAASRGGSRAASPAMSVRSRASRRTKHRTPSPPPLPSSDADSESESDSDHGPTNIYQNNEDEDALGPPPPPPSTSWQCEHCTFVNEPGIRVCAVCCRTPIVSPTVVANKLNNNMEKLKINDNRSTPSSRTIENQRLELNGQKTGVRSKKERSSIACGPSPPREEKPTRKPINRLVTPTRDQSTGDTAEVVRKHHDMAVGPSPPKEVKQNQAVEVSPTGEQSKTMKVSPYRETKDTNAKRHSVSVGPSPTREIAASIEKKSTGTSPPRDTVVEAHSSSASTKARVSNTGTSPPPQSISTQTYEVPNSWERAPSAVQARSRRRFRDENRRERSHSRHSMSSDTRESERSVRTSGAGGRWEWRERDSSPGGEGSEGYSRLSRRASHLDLRRTRSNRRTSFYGSEAPSPEPQSTTRAVSLEALAGVGARREAERGLELARLMSEAEQLGFSAAEVQAALAQSPAAPLAWLRARWPSLVAGVQAAAIRLAPAANITEMDARAALARHRGAMWPAVTECVDKHRIKTEAMNLGEERRLRGHVWGPPAGADDEAAPPEVFTDRSHRKREDSSDEFEAFSPTKLEDDQWMYLPLDMQQNNMYMSPPEFDLLDIPVIKESDKNKTDIIAQPLEHVLKQDNVPITGKMLVKNDLLSASTQIKNVEDIEAKIASLDLIQSENDFINAYNALARTSPLPNVSGQSSKTNNFSENYITPNQENLTFGESQPIIPNYEMTTTDATNNIDKLPKNTKIRPETKEPKEVKSSQQINLRRHRAKVLNSSDSEEDARQAQKNSHLILQENRIVGTELKNNNFRPTPLKPEASAVHENTLKSEEKSTNLNDIVDNTQKLIQQMKEEINSDINSIDGRNISESEQDSSSHAEQESSYSETDEGSENLTSDEKEMSSTDDDDTPGQDEYITRRTSSEDNEQFEEALDNLDNQIENFRHANIEILNSIARSLQKEHPVAVEIINPKSVNQQKQDLNNNLFVAVNSFDEIYEELSVNNSLKNMKNITELNNENDFTEAPLQDITVLEKHVVNFSSLKVDAPMRVLHFENKYPIYQAILQNIEEDPESKNVDVMADTVSTSTVGIHIEDESELVENDLQSPSPDIVSDEVTLHGSRKNSPEAESRHLVTPNSDESLQQSNLTNIPLNSENIQQRVITISEEDRQNNLNSYGEPSEQTISVKSHGNNKSNPVATKSNIPKLIKLAQNAKAKIDKRSPKVIVSKVPIRKTSVKQYPAPAPPKANFGNIQSGHVKQLQTRLFNNKSADSPSNKDNDLLESTSPSTSTQHKKKLAPPPPVSLSQNRSSPPKTQDAQKKSNYFRETCRTEDEWTDSDSEDSSQLQIVKPIEEETSTPPSPPPPITVRRVSGQLIDLAKVQLPHGSPERQARMLLAEGATETWEQAQLAVELIAQGVETPNALLAALECADLTSALNYLHQDCELCASRLPEHEMVSMLRCTHRCCRECARLYFTVQITERSIADCVCPYCKVPELESLPEDAWLEYFAHLDILLKTLLEIDVHELFQRKLRDRTLARDPNFRWCMECSSGFFVHPKQKKLRCPECKSISCASCRKPWTSNHDGLTCEQYAVWLEDNDPERSVAAVQQHLRENGLECPRCHFKYSLSRGGCMHFTCTQCKYEFCYGCGKPFTMGARCGLSEYCAKLGLHAHHPRNCLFYLRDKEPHELQTLLQMNNVTYETEAAESSSARCPLQLQRETPTGLVDGTCGNEAPANYAGLCKNHYLEYLSRLVRRYSIDPLPILGVDDLETLVRRAALRLPPRPYGSLEGLYKRSLAEIVKEKIPLD